MRSNPIPFLTMATAVALLCACANQPSESIRQAADATRDCNSEPARSGPEVEAIARLERQGAASNVKGWSEADAKAFFAPEWISIGPGGTMAEVNDVLATFNNGRSVPWAGRFDFEQLDVRVYCDSAVVIGTAAAYRIGSAGAKHKPEVKFRWLNVWHKRNGRWVNTANQFDQYIDPNQTSTRSELR